MRHGPPRSVPRWARCSPSTRPALLPLPSYRALSVPVPAQREGESEIWIAELGLVGELWRGKGGRPSTFNRGVSSYPALGDRVRVGFHGRAGAGLLRRHAAIGSRRQHPPGQFDPGDDPRRRAARQALRHPRHDRHRQVLHDGADPARHPRKEPCTRMSSCSIPTTSMRPPSREWAEVISPRNMQLPYWLLTFEELVEVVIGNPPSARTRSRSCRS